MSQSKELEDIFGLLPTLIFLGLIIWGVYSFFQSPLRVAEAVCQGNLSLEGALVEKDDSWAWIKLERTRGATWVGALPFSEKTKQVGTVQIRVGYPSVPIELPTQFKPNSSNYIEAYSAGPTWFGAFDFKNKGNPYNVSFLLSKGRHLEIAVFSPEEDDDKGEEIAVAYHAHHCSLLEGFD